MKRSEVDKNKLTPMMIQYLNIKDKHEDVVIFFRLGDFYEMFFEDALLCSRELQIALTGKSAGLEERIPMCGVPHHSAESYISKLVERGYKVGICEQLSDPKDSKTVVERDIVQIVSKGMVMNTDYLNEKENNYIANIIDYKDFYLVSYADLSTGELNVVQVEYCDSAVINQLVNLNIKEVIVNLTFNKKILEVIEQQFNIIVSFYDEIIDYEDYNYLFVDKLSDKQKKTVKHLLTYLTETQKRSLLSFKKINIIDNKDFLRMDHYTKRNLDLIENNRTNSKEYSLLWLLDKTKTAMGGRLLKKWIENPLTKKKDIAFRHNIIETLSKEFFLLEEIRTVLVDVYDLERLAGKIEYGNVNGRDLIQLKKSLNKLPELSKLLKKLNYKKELANLSSLFKLLETSLYEEPPLSLKEGYLIKEGYNDYLDELKEIRSNGKEYIARLEKQERNKTNIKNLKIGFNRVFGYYIEVSKGNVNLIKDEYGYERKQTLVSSERYITSELKEKEALILSAEDKIFNLEYDLFIEIREKTKQYISKLQEVSLLIAEIDVLTSFTVVAEKNNYIKPKLTNKQEIVLKDARHPLVEIVNKYDYVPNDVILKEDKNIILITGPNMSGKSTYLRMLGIIAIMNQIGMYIPAKEAVMPIFDAIYTRIGASDDLVGGESTFMVEMVEANNALQNASSNSLILFDELGRGTATFDGMSLAQAILEYIHDNIKCKTIFSTHYHELTALAETNQYLINQHVSVLEKDGEITFLHKVIEGNADKSYGIHVARLAKLPLSLISRANQVLKIHETKEKEKDVIIQTSLPFETNETDPLKEELSNLNISNLTPLEALNILNDLKNNLK